MNSIAPFILEAIVHAEEECIVFLPLGTIDRIELLVQNQSIFSRQWVVPEWLRSSRFCFRLGSACKRKYFRLRLRGLLLVVLVLFVDQVRDQSMRNSDPRVGNVCSQIQF